MTDRLDLALPYRTQIEALTARARAGRLRPRRQYVHAAVNGTSHE